MLVTISKKTGEDPFSITNVETLKETFSQSQVEELLMFLSDQKKQFFKGIFIFIF